MYFLDEAWTTVPVHSATKASTVVAIISKKKFVLPHFALTSSSCRYVEPETHGLYVSDSNVDVAKNERLLGPAEFPLEIQVVA